MAAGPPLEAPTPVEPACESTVAAADTSSLSYLATGSISTLFDTPAASAAVPKTLGPQPDPGSEDGDSYRDSDDESIPLALDLMSGPSRPWSAALEWCGWKVWFWAKCIDPLFSQIF